MNIIYAHCSVLIITAEFKLKMSRSYCYYDEEWQRRKSVLIRSLFHDLPTLSPVTEESDDSYPPTRPYEPLEDPPRPYSPLPPLIIERVPKINKHDEPEEHYKKLLIKIKRIYRRLFILNRNLSSDEEFFSDKSEINDDFDLHSPLARENDDNDLDQPIINIVNDPVNETEKTNELDDDQSDINDIDDNINDDQSDINDIDDNINDDQIDINDIDDNINDDQSDINDNTNFNDETVRLSTNSNVSNGYRADSESIETVIVDVLNYTKSSNGEASRPSEDNSNHDSESAEDENLKKTEDERSSDQETGHDVSPSSNEESNREESIVEEQLNIIETADYETDTNTRLISTRTALSISDAIEELNEQEMVEEECEHDHYEDKSNEENSHQEELMEEEIIDRRITNQYSTEENNLNDSQKELTNVLREERKNRFEDLNKSRMNIKEANKGGSDNSSSSDKEWSASALDEIENMQGVEVGEERRMAVVPADMMVEDEVEVLSDIGSYYRQITTAALVHVDATEDIPEIESQVYEDSPKSVILPIRRMKRTAPQALLDRREELIEVTRSKESRAETKTSSHSASSENIEEMRSQKRKLSQASEPEISHKRICEEYHEFIRPSLDLTDVTSSSQNGGNFNISEHRTSNDFEEILARILNESEINNENINFEDETSPQNGGNLNFFEHNKSNDINLCRKRKIFDDVSVQTSGNVSWDDIRNELFVGTPKIMRLCSCVDHVCQ